MVTAKLQGRDFNFYQKLSVTATVFNTDADTVMKIPVRSFMLLNEGTTSSQVVEYSFNGNTVHGELDPSLPSRGLTFDNRVANFIWFRMKAGSTGPVNVRVDAWSER